MSELFNPFEPGEPEAAWPRLRELREQGAVVEIANRMRYVTRWSECRAVMRDTETFSNASGMKAPGVEVPLEDRILGELDPPRHTLVRRVMVTALTPKVVHGAEPFVRETAGSLLDALPGEGVVDLVPAFTVPLPNRVTCHLLGFPPEDADTIAGWAKELMESTFPATNRTERGEGFAAAFPEFAGYIDERIEQRAAELAGPGEHDEDVISRLLALEVDGERLSRRTLRALVRNLVTGGLTTTSQLLGNLVHQILTVPGLEAAVRSDPDRLARAVDESLRLAPPVLFVARGCVRDTEVGGVEIHAGERLVVGTGSANRDEQVFAAAESFDVDRPNADQHLSFGYGPHVCPGATLARVEARIALEVLLERFPPSALALEPGYDYENVPTYFEVGPRRLPVLIGG